MTWLDILLERKVGKSCPLCPQAPEARLQAVLVRDKVDVPPLSPACSQEDTFLPQGDKGQEDKGNCPLELSPSKPLSELHIEPQETKGTEGTRNLDDSPNGWDVTLEALASGLPLEDAQDLREERAAILEFEAGMERGMAGQLAGLRTGHR